MIKHLISFYTVKWCYSASFRSGHTKKKARKVFLENAGLLADVGVGIMTENVLSSVEVFICRLYGVTKTISVDAARHIPFSRRGKPENLPSASDALSFHVKYLITR